MVFEEGTIHNPYGRYDGGSGVQKPFSFEPRDGYLLFYLRRGTLSEWVVVCI